MELDRPHHRPTPNTSSTSSEIFICFTSNLSSSSSMKIAKSFLSPGRSRDPPMSLSTSLSRRLRTNGSIKGGQASPMFPTGGKKRGCGFENPEPSSPKVTCIGQVRVKTKKKVKQTRSLSRRGSGEVSFRRVEQQSHDLLKNSDVCAGMQQQFAPANSSSHFQQQECLQHRNQRWVHLPVTICEALRAFGAEFSCLFPCRSCFSTSEREKEEKANNGHEMTREEENNGQSSCGAVFARWFVALQDSEGGKGREIELVVGGDEERTEVRERTSMRSSRRHVFEDIEFKEETIEVKGEGGEEEEKARVSICIPPKNALLLMRCRSDPMKMATLANSFWESPAPKDGNEVEDEEDGEEEENLEENNDLKDVEDSECTDEAKLEVQEGDDEVSDLCISAENNEEVENQEKDANLAMEMEETEEEKVEEESYDNEELEETKKEAALVENEEAEPNEHSFEDHVDREMAEKKEENPIQEKEMEESEEENSEIDYSSSSENSDRQNAESETEKEALESNIAAEEEENEEKTEKSTLEEETQETSFEEINEENQTTTLFLSESDDTENAQEAAFEAQENDGAKTEEKSLTETKDDQEKSTSSSNMLPDCLLLMMCEPKLSMEVSKETWVCSTDFIRWLPERPVKRKVNVSDKSKKRVGTDSNGPPPQENMIQQQQQQQQVMQPPRSSCTLPAAAAVSMAAMIEQKLVNAAVASESLVLTRCKSEPMRTAAAKLMPEACFWKNRKHEPHRSAKFGVGAAGVGF